jgi:hypothetical protein
VPLLSEFPRYFNIIKGANALWAEVSVRILCESGPVNMLGHPIEVSALDASSLARHDWYGIPPRFLEGNAHRDMFVDSKSKVLSGFFNWGAEVSY